MMSNFATIFKQDLEYISKCILDYPDIETGGDFFGFWNNLGLPVILYVTGPGENCYRHSTFFKQDLDFLLNIGNFVYKEYGLQHIGSWHSHHKLGLAVPSYHDCNTMANAIKNNSLSKFFMILGNIPHSGGTTINGFLFDSENFTNYKETEWKILSTENVISKSIDENINKTLIYKPKTKKPFLKELKIINGNESVIYTLDFEPQSWVGSDKGKTELKEVFNWFDMRFGNAKMFVTSSNDLEIKTNDIVVTFFYDFPNSYPKVQIENNNLTEETGVFNYNDFSDILEYITSKINTFTANIKVKNDPNDDCNE